MQRLKTRNQFQTVLAGQTVARTPHFALHACELAPAGQSVSATTPQPMLFQPADVWIGALVPKRWARRAVMRNAIKRQIYTVSGLFEPSLPKAAHVVRLRAAFDRAKFSSPGSALFKQAVRIELEQLFRKCAAPEQKVLT